MSAPLCIYYRLYDLKKSVQLIVAYPNILFHSYQCLLLMEYMLYVHGLIFWEFQQLFHHLEILLLVASSHMVYILHQNASLHLKTYNS